jgi:hypothetical protein
MPSQKNHPISFLCPNPAELMPIAEHEKLSPRILLSFLA